MKKKIFSILLALVLVVSFSLVAAVPVTADPGYVGYEFGLGNANDTATWDTESEFGNYSVKLTKEGTGEGGGDGSTHVEFIPAGGTTVDDLATIGDTSFWYYQDNVWGAYLELHFADPDSAGFADVTVQALQNADTGAWYELVVDPSETKNVFVNGNTTLGHWFEDLSADITLANALGKINSKMDEVDDQTPDVDAADWELTRIRVQLWDAVEVDYYSYIDDVTIDGTLYELEPIILDTAHPYFYKTGATIGVTVPNMNANADPHRADVITYDSENPGTYGVKVTSTNDLLGLTVDLEETDISTGVFQASFVITDEEPTPTDELYVEDGDIITVTYYGANFGTDSAEDLDVTATVDDTEPTIGTLTPGDGTIEYNTKPTISAIFTEDDSDIDEDSIVMTVNGATVTTEFADSTVSYTSPALAPGSTVEVTVDVEDMVGNSAETAEWSFTIASALNVTVDPTTWTAGNAQNLVVTITDVEGCGVMHNDEEPAANELAWVKVVVTAPVGQTLSTGEWTGADGVCGDAIGSVLGTILTFTDLLPNDASSDITVTVTGKLVLDDTPVGPVTKTIPVSGFVVTGITPSENQVIDTTSAISMTVTTKAGEPVPTGTVTITADEAAGFEKDVNPATPGLESFTVITIDGLTGQIRYGGAFPETYSVTGGVYQVTGIKYVKLGEVTIQVGSIQAKFAPAFTVVGEPAYTLTPDPSTVVAGIANQVDLTVTEDGTQITGATLAELMDRLTAVQGTATLSPAKSVVGNVIRLTGLRPEDVRSSDALAPVTISVYTTDLSKTGSVDIAAVEPDVVLTIDGVAEAKITRAFTESVSITITDPRDDSEIATADLQVTATNLKLELDSTDDVFSDEPEMSPHFADAGLLLDGTGAGDTPDSDTALNSATYDFDALAYSLDAGETASITLSVCDDASTWIKVATVSIEDATATVSPDAVPLGVASQISMTNAVDAHGQPLADETVQLLLGIVLSTGSLNENGAITFVVTPSATGTIQAQVYDSTSNWQTLGTVTVVSEAAPETIDLYEGANPIHYTGATTDLPGALTNIADITEVIWQRDVSTGGDWWFYLVPLDHGPITQLENGKVYIVVVSQDCTWELPQ